ncbi:hypothetical protein [Endozoicomonas atrinae]|uniref:hypothetical protein n=1 Tax=Endozoicomonas atrinae TaxID=1333660 RepID=UPI003AFF8F77
MKRWQNNIPEYLISPLTTGFRKISIGVVKDSLYLGFFEFLHNVGRRGKSLLQPLVNLLVT